MVDQGGSDAAIADRVDFDVDAALAAARDVAGDGVLTAVVYTDESFRIRFVDDAVREMYEDEEHMRAHFRRIHSHHSIDVHERTLLEDQLPGAGRVRYLVTKLEHAAMLRLVDAATAGLWVTLRDDCPVVETAEVMRDAAMDGPDESSPFA